MIGSKRVTAVFVLGCAPAILAAVPFTVALADLPPLVLAQRQLLPSVGHGLVTGDLDGSLGPDIAGIDRDRVTVLRNLGARTFSDPQSIPVGEGGLSYLALPDLNGDGRPDLVATRTSPPAVVVRLNLGGFEFEQPVVYPLAEEVRGLETGDLDGNRRPDIVLVCGARIVSLLAHADGSLGEPAVTQVGAGLFAFIALADFNGDGLSDLAMATWDVFPGTDYEARSWIEWRDGNGEGTFGAPQLIQLGDRPLWSMLSADFDGDGDHDLVTTTTPEFQWFENVGGGTFRPHAPVALDLGNYDLVPMNAGDLDGDGAADLAIAGWRGLLGWNRNNLVSVVMGLADDAHRRTAIWHVTAVGDRVAITDIDRDGHNDIVTASGGEDVGLPESGTALLWNRGHGTFLGRSTLPVDPAFGLRAVRRNRSALPDLVSKAWSAGIIFLPNAGDGTFMAARTIFEGDLIGAWDLDEDGAEDIFAKTETGYAVMYRKRGAIEFEAPVVIDERAPIGVGDFDGDGHVDLCLQGPDGTIWTRRGNGTRSFQPAIAVGTAPPNAWLCLRDLDADGRTDLAYPEQRTIRDEMSGQQRGVLHVQLNDGLGHFMDDQTDSLDFEEHDYWYGPAYSNGPAVPADVDGDGDPDFVLSFAGAFCWWGVLTNDGSGHFSAPGPGHEIWHDISRPVSGDLNADGLDDILLSISDSGSFGFGVFNAREDGQLVDISGGAGVNYQNGASLEDFDGNGRRDIALLGADEASVDVFFNFSPGLPTPVLITLISARVWASAVELEWHGRSESSEGTVERTTDGALWTLAGTASFENLESLRFRDDQVVPGQRYAYRLRYRDGGRERLTAETWIQVPSASLSIHPLGPQPAPHLPVFAITAPAAGVVAVEIIDIAGRRLQSASLQNESSGEVRFVPSRLPSAGLYFVRARQGASTAISRVVVTP